jgi:spoIIIJ-associated protein
MSLNKKDYYGKEVTDAIRQACADLQVPQEQLDIEVVEPGSTGIFGLRRKKAHIRAVVKTEVKTKKTEMPSPPTPEVRKKEEKAVVQAAEIAPPRLQPKKAEADPETPIDDFPEDIPENGEEEGEASAEAVALVQADLTALLDLMRIPSRIELEVQGLSVHCTIHGEHEEELIGQEGKILDSLQYLLRKIIAKKISERLRISIDVGEFRQKRIEELKEKALELAALVKEDGKTQIIAALNPSERRVVHMVLQEDKEIRSRSVGEGLFKKILIYKPGKGNKTGGRKRPPSRGRKGKGPNAPANEDES